MTGACGLIKGGTPGNILDPVPNGPIVAQGTLTVMKAGKTINGQVAVHQLSTTGEYVIRLENLTAPVESGLIVVGKVNGVKRYQGSLRGPSGNQNYPTGINTSGLGWSTVSIATSTLPDGQNDYAVATLGPPPI